MKLTKSIVGFDLLIRTFVIGTAAAATAVVLVLV